MHPEPSQQAQESAENQTHVPYKGFVNVNEIVERRRQLKDAAFNVSDPSWDADLNPQEKTGLPDNK